MWTEDEGYVHKLQIMNPTTIDVGKYSCDIDGLVTSAYLDVDGKCLN